jgi:hypothetical protein
VADVTWSLALPTWFLADGYDLQPGENLVASKTDVGPPIVRFRSAASPQPERVAMAVSYAEFLLFRAWFAADLRYGARTFELGVPGAPVDPRPVLQTDDEADLTDDDGEPIELDFDWLYTATYRFSVATQQRYDLTSREPPWYVLTLNLLRLDEPVSAR